MLIDDVVVLIVTYGDRSALLQQVVSRLIDMECRNILIVDNGSSVRHANFISGLEHCEQISVIRNYENLGSAGGISSGLLYFMTMGRKYLWILDDDNLPDFNALDSILSMVSSVDMSINALHSSRFSSSGDLARFPNNRRSSFFEFDIFNIISRIRNLLMRPQRDYYMNEIKLLPYAPYGGLFISADLIAKIGFPNQDMYLYVDDSEYTWRISSTGGSIMLITKSVIRDVDTYWGVSYPRPRLFTQILFESDFNRGFYTLRNHAYFDKFYWRENHFVYLINKSIFIAILFILSLYHKRINRFFNAVRAIYLGDIGLLGKRGFK